jgi:transposase InsO family protein
MAIPNLIQGIIIDAPYLVWVSDFTYLPFFGMFVYLATVEDIFTRQIVGWQISVKHNTNLVIDALLNALSKHPYPNICHSDQGSEYRSLRYQGNLIISRIKPSMSEKSSPWQNGFQESFYSEFKLELGHPECYPTLGELIEAIARQIHYYNNERIHTALKYPPAVFALKYQSQKLKSKVVNTNKVENEKKLNNLNFSGITARQSV